MVVSISTLVAMLFYSTSSTTALTEIADQALQLSSLPDVLDSFSSNITSSSLNASAANNFKIECNGNHFGYNLNLGDCQDAQAYVIPDSKQWNFALRSTPHPDDYYPLPYRLMGGKHAHKVPQSCIADTIDRQSRMLLASSTETRATLW